MKHRVYDFELPYTVNSFEVMMGIGELKDKGIFTKLPKDLQEQMDSAQSSWSDVTITKKMCDEIDEKTWEELATIASLKYHYR